jgi:hypothetical protein
MPPAKKQIPEITLDNLSPPYKDYAYFKDGNTYGFQFDATGFSLINAWWLSDAATLVYADEAFVRSQFTKAGLPEIRFFQKNGTQCYVAGNERFAIVAFRGSEIWKRKEKVDLNEMLSDLTTNVDIRLTDWVPGGKVHRGFKDALEEVWPDLLPYIMDLQRRGRAIWVTGHSLGAALATLCAARHPNVQGVYTFGSPRVGDAAFRESLEVDIYRVVNNADIVPRVPPPVSYVHVGKLMLIDAEGILRQGNFTDPPPESTDGRQTVNPSTRHSLASLIPAAIRDHVPVLYAIHLWNNAVDRRN